MVECHGLSMRVIVRVAPWLSELLGASGTLVLEKVITEGETLLGLLEKLGEKNESFRKDVFDYSERRVRNGVLVVLNGRFVAHPDMESKRLRDGDEITLTPAYLGG